MHDTVVKGYWVEPEQESSTSMMIQQTGRLLFPSGIPLYVRSGIQGGDVDRQNKIGSAPLPRIPTNIRSRA